MSRIGRKPIPVPAGVKIQLAPRPSKCKAPRASCTIPVPRGIHFEQKDGTLLALRESDERRALHGLARALVANAVRGVTEGFKKDLDIVGVGYRAELKGKKRRLRAGLFASGRLPRARRHSDRGGKADPSHRERRGPWPVGQVAANIRGLAPARSLQAEGHPLVWRAPEEEGRQGWRRQDRRISQRSRRSASTATKGLKKGTKRKNGYEIGSQAFA